MNYEKHVGVYDTIDKLTEEITNSVLVSPWVAYVKNKESYDVYYSNDMVVSHNSLNVAELLAAKIMELDNRIVSLTEDEYENLTSLAEGETLTVTAPNGDKKEISYDPKVYYCTYDPSDLK